LHRFLSNRQTYKVQYGNIPRSKNKLSERLVEIPVHRSVRDRIREMKKGESYSEYLIRLTKISEGHSLQAQPSDESHAGDSNG